MSTPSWTDLEALFHDALARAPAEREAFLAERCAGRPELQTQIEAMLRAHQAAASAEGRPGLIGQHFGSYQILSLIGSGGMGDVYRALDTKLNRPVAIKFLSEDLADSTARRRFQREAQTASSLNHPHILTVHDAGEVENRQYLVTEFVDGGTLREWTHGARHSWRQTIELLIGVADGIAAAHEAGILHRDVKPDNILITKSGYAKLADFGLAKLAEGVERGTTRAATAVPTRPGVIIGTVAYMSPEQAAGQAVDARSDIFAFGVVLYELLAGRHPFEAATDLERLQAIVHQPAAALADSCPDLPTNLRMVVEKALAKEPAERYQSMREIVVDLRRVLRQSDSAAIAAQGRTLRWKRVAAIAVTIAVAAGVTWWTNVGGVRARLGPVASSPQIHAIGVLPLRNVSRDPDQDYFADGMTEALTTSLAQISSLSVIARASMNRYEGTTKSASEIANEVNIDGLIQGAVQRAGNRVRISAQLIEASNDRVRWAGSYERDVRDALALQNEIAQAIAQEVQVQLTPQERARLTKSPAIDPVAQEADFRGHYWAQRGDYQKALEYFQQAIARDPNYAEAHAALGGLYGMLTYLGSTPAQESYPKWRAAVTRALELDETLAEAHESLGSLLLYHDWNWQDSEREFRRAILLNPNLATVHLWYSDVLAYTGRTTEAVAEARRGQQLNPFNVNAHQILGYQLIFARRNDEAIEQGRKMLEVEGGAGVGHWVSGFAYEQQGRLAQAISEFQQAAKLGAPVPTVPADLAHAYAISGKTKEALEIAAELTAKSKQQFVHSWGLAVVYAGLGDKDHAFEWLEKAYDERPSDMASIKVDPRMEPLRSDPRYQELLRRMSLPP